MFFTQIGGSPSDTTPPVISGCPSGITVQAISGENTAQAVWTEPTATDDSGKSPNLRQSHSPGFRFTLNPPTTEVTYEFTDDARNTARCSFTVTVSGKSFTVGMDFDTIWLLD